LRQAPKSLERFFCAQVGGDGTSLEADNGEVVTGVDVIIFATGFDITAPLGQFDIRARGTTLEETFEAVPEAYYGTAVAGFPNLFTLLGPNTGTASVLTSSMLHVGRNRIVAASL
jgi:cation diffusion facilitator CzcD-associated flavoprotein CzcO